MQAFFVSTAELPRLPIFSIFPAFNQRLKAEADILVFHFKR